MAATKFTTTARQGSGAATRECSLDQCDLSMGQEFLREFRNLLAEGPLLAALGTLYNQYRLSDASNFGWPKLPLHRSAGFIPKKEI
jgi:hypothetical protein